MHRRLSLPLSLSFGIACTLLLSCAASEEPVSTPSAEALAFADAAAEQGVPEALLLAIAAVEGGLGMPAYRDVAKAVELPAAGPLMLRRGQLDTLALAASLSGESEWTLRKDTDLALRASARVIAHVGKSFGAQPVSLESYARAIEEFSGYADDEHREEYMHRVYAMLAAGGSFEGRDGTRMHLLPHAIRPELTMDLSGKLSVLAGAEYPGALYFPIPASKVGSKLTVGRAGNKVQHVVIHDTEGGWDASVATLQNDSGKSVHYIIDVNGRVGQFVSEADTAYHAGNIYYNMRSVGIEHIGYATKPYATAEYAASAKLVKHLASKYGVLLDRAHIIGHDQIPNANQIPIGSPPCSDAPNVCTSSSNYGGAAGHSDPGVWEWARLMYLIGGKAKLNDVRPLWNCSSDTLFAFRQASGQVEVQECTRCDVMPTGTNDVCVPKPGGGGPPPDVDASVPPSEVDAGPIARDAGGPVLLAPHLLRLQIQDAVAQPLVARAHERLRGGD
jgi:N-acetyl-anhydromuramyl-L-alanine amidase AmpD